MHQVKRFDKNTRPNILHQLHSKWLNVQQFQVTERENSFSEILDLKERLKLNCHV